MLLLPLLMPALVSFAGDDLKPVLSGRDDAEFGRALASSGYGDLAEKLCFAIQKQYGSDPAKALECEALLGDIHLDQAYREPDAGKKREKLEKVLDEKTNFVTAHGDAPSAETVVASLPDLYRVLGDTLIGLIDTTTDDTAKGDLRREAGKVFEQAESFLGKRVGELRRKWNAAQEAARGEEQPEPPAAPGPLMAAANAAGDRLLGAIAGFARTKYYHSTTLAPEDEARKKLLQEVTSLYDDVELDFPDKLLTFEGFIFRGLALDGMGNTEAALKSFDQTIKIREYFPPPDAKGTVFQVPPEVADVISNAVHQKMLLLVKKGQADEAIKVAKDFFSTTLDPYSANRAIAILATLAEAYDAVGDRKGMESTAQKLIDMDRLGPGGQKGRQLLSGGAGGASKLGARNLLALANEAAGKGDADKAMDYCRQVLALARGTKQESELGAEACVLLGVLYAQKDMFEEAVVAWDAAVERYIDGPAAPDALWRSINGYIKLNAKQKRGIWDKRYRERVDTLATKFPKHPNASRVTLLEGQRREDEGDFIAAAQIYEKVQKGNPAFEEAEFRAGNSYAKHANKLSLDGKTADATTFYGKAEQVLRKTAADVQESLKKTLEPDLQARLAGIDFSARVALSGVLLSKAVNKPGEVPDLLADAEKLFPGDAGKLGNIWDLRFRAYQAMGKLDVFLGQLETSLKNPQTAAGLDRVAVNTGRAFDTKAIETLRDKPDSPEVDALIKKSFDWYMRGLAPQLDGRQAVDAGTIEGIAKRLFIFGLHLNRVPAETQTFIDWKGRVVAPETWEAAVRLYTAVIPYSSNSSTLLELARVQCWLGKLKDAAPNFQKVFDREKFADLGNQKIDPEMLQTRTDLLFALLEWGIAEQGAAKGGDEAHAKRATDIFVTLGNNVAKDSKLWWQAKYLWLRMTVDKGEYAQADIVIRSIARSTTGYDGGKYGFKELFEALDKELDTKLPGRPK